MNIEKEYEQSLKGKDVFCSQDISKCIELSDIHINNPHINKHDFNVLKRQLAWYVSLIMHPGIVMPSWQERCMQLAFTAKLSSGCISRQVGAAITDESYALKTIGWNSTPQGQPPCLLRNIYNLLSCEDTEAYSEFENTDKKFRDYAKKKYVEEIDIRNCSEKLSGRNVSFCFKKLKNNSSNEDNQVHTRALHAEENAFLQISKFGGSGLKGGVLFSTASPCELCSKKAYQLGISKIVYIDPYPGIAQSHILQAGNNRPEVILFHGAIGRAYNQLFEPILPYKDELELILGLQGPPK